MYATLAKRVFSVALQKPDETEFLFRTNLLEQLVSHFLFFDLLVFF